MIAYDPSGSLIVLTDGHELLVHDGPSEGPLWRRSDDLPLIAVGAAAGAVIAVDASGRARWFDARRDHAQAAAESNTPAHAAAISSRGDVLLATADGARVLTRSGPGPALACPGATAVAWSADGRMLVGTGDGKAVEFAADARPLRTVQLDAAIVAATWSPQGFWILATARKLARLEGGDLHHLTNAPDGYALRHLAVSADGSRIALGLGDDLVLVMAWPSRDGVGQLRYLDRKVDGLAFGPAPWLGVGLEGGDGNKFNLQTGDLNRTDTHPGREHRRWLVKVSANPPAEPEPIRERAAYAPPAESRERSNPLKILIIVAILGILAAYLAVRM